MLYNLTNEVEAVSFSAASNLEFGEHNQTYCT